MKRKVYKVWVQRTDSETADLFSFFDDVMYVDAEMYKTKGRKEQYPAVDWPPRRAKITVEIED